MKKYNKGTIKICLLSELTAVALILLVSVALYAGTMNQVKNTCDVMIFRMNEMLYDYDDPVPAAKEALRTIQTIEKTSGYEGNVSAVLIDNSDEGSFWLEERWPFYFTKRMANSTYGI